MPAPISQYSSTPASNARTSPAGWPEDMPRSGVNNSDREFAAAVRDWYDDPEWLALMRTSAGDAHTVTGSGSDKVVIAGVDVRAYFPVGRRIQVTGTGTPEGKVTATTLATNTEVTVLLDAGVSVPGDTSGVKLYFAKTLVDQVPAATDFALVDAYSF